MENRYLFKAKRIDNGEWFEGAYYTDYPQIDRHMIICHDINGEYGGLLYHSIDPATLGQCTGIKDKNEKLIFEGDILEWIRPNLKNPETIYGIVAWQTERWIVELLEGRMVDTSGIWCLSAAIDRNAKIIGNRWDNPELLGGEGAE